MARASYSRWDGTQDVGDLSGDDILRRLMDDLLEHGDADQSLRRLMQQGFTDGSGRAVAGLRELLKRVRRRRAQLSGDAFAELERAMSTRSPEALARERRMLAELNEMVERQHSGEDVSAEFDRFVQHYSDLVPGRPSSLDQLLQSLAERLAATRALLDSMTPQQRARLAELSEALLDNDLELRMELDRLASHMPLASPDDPFAQISLGLAPASSLTGQLSDLAQLESMLSGAPSPGALAEVDIERPASSWEPRTPTRSTRWGSSPAGCAKPAWWNKKKAGCASPRVDCAASATRPSPTCTPAWRSTAPASTP